jgi:septal ring factor EnvC (AmiA/AmiB activator)
MGELRRALSNVSDAVGDVVAQAIDEDAREGAVANPLHHLDRLKEVIEDQKDERAHLLDELSAAAGAGLGEPWKARARENPVEAMEKLRELLEELTVAAAEAAEAAVEASGEQWTAERAAAEPLTHMKYLHDWVRVRGAAGSSK